MLTVAVESQNVFYRQGMISMLDYVKQSKSLNDYKILDADVKNFNETANIIFTDNAVIINIFSKDNTITQPGKKSGQPSAIHITFNVSGLFIEDIHSFIVRIFTAATLPHDGVEKSDFYRHFKIRKNAQLSEPEKRLVLLSGHGHDIRNISHIMRCSTNSSYTYRRNAIKKLGMDNRLQFYKYVQILNKFEKHNNIFICL